MLESIHSNSPFKKKPSRDFDFKWPSKSYLNIGWHPVGREYTSHLWSLDQDLCKEEELISSKFKTEKAEPKLLNPLNMIHILLSDLTLGLWQPLPPTLPKYPSKFQNQFHTLMGSLHIIYPRPLKKIVLALKKIPCTPWKTPTCHLETISLYASIIYGPCHRSSAVQTRSSPSKLKSHNRTDIHHG